MGGQRNHAHRRCHPLLPTFFLILTAVALLGPNILNIIAVIGLVSWTGTARLVRAEFLTLRESETCALHGHSASALC